MAKKRVKVVLTKLRGYEYSENGPGVGEVGSMVAVPPYNLEEPNSSAPWMHHGLGRTVDGGWYICASSDGYDDDDEDKHSATLVSEAEAKRLVLSRVPQDYEKFFGEPAPERQRG